MLRGASILIELLYLLDYIFWGLWLTIFFRDHEFSGFTWARFAEAPSGLLERSPICTIQNTIAASKR